MIEKYLQDIGSQGQLSQEEENRLAQQVREGNEQALGQLVSANLRFVVSLASQYQGKGLPIDDLVNEGNIALIKAVRSFDPSKGTRLVVFAASRIRQAMEKALSKEEEVSNAIKEATERGKTVEQYPNAPILSPLDSTISTKRPPLTALDERERQVIAAIYGIDQPQMTLAEIGMQMGVTRERARQIRDKALRKLRKHDIEQ